MKKALFALISFGLGIVLFFWLLNEIGWQKIKSVFLSFSGLEGGIILSLAILGAVLGTLRWREILKSKGYDFSLRELFGNYLASFAITYLAPMILLGGEIFRGYSLNSKEKNSASLEKGMAASFIDAIFEYVFEWGAAFLGLVAFFLTAGLSLGNSQAIAFIILVLAGGGTLGYFLFKGKSLIKILFGVDEQNQVRKIEREVFSFFRIKNRFFQKATLFSFSKAFLRFFQYWILVEFLGKSICLPAAVSVWGISVLLMAPPISADLGTHDLGAAILFSKLGIGREVGAVFASIIRGTNLILAISGIAFLIKTGIVVLQRKFSEKINKIFLNNNSNHEK